MNLLVICIYFLDKCLFSSLVHTTIWYLLLWCMSFCYTLHGLCISYNWKLVPFDNLYPVFPSTSSLPLGTTNMIFFSEFNLFLFFFLDFTNKYGHTKRQVWGGQRCGWADSLPGEFNGYRPPVGFYALISL